MSNVDIRPLYRSKSSAIHKTKATQEKLKAALDKYREGCSDSSFNITQFAKESEITRNGLYHIFKTWNEGVSST